MSIMEMAFLGLVIAVFSALGLVLAITAWRCRDAPPVMRQRRLRSTGVWRPRSLRAN